MSTLSEDSVKRVASAGAVKPALPLVPEQRDAGVGVTSAQQHTPAMVQVRGGCFRSGDPYSAEDRAGGQSGEAVCVDRFAIGKYEVTWREWEKIMGKTEWAAATRCPECPADGVSWAGVQEFIRRLNARTGGGYRLPTEAEWEHACRRGGNIRWVCGASNDISQGRGYFWFQLKQEHEIAGYNNKPDRLGVFGLAGGVPEWTCSPWEGRASAPVRVCAGKEDTESTRVVRGGAFPFGHYVSVLVHRSSYDIGGPVSVAGDGISVLSMGPRMGFRLARD